jgi:hypothetical protein
MKGRRGGRRQDREGVVVEVGWGVGKMGQEQRTL